MTREELADALEDCRSRGETVIPFELVEAAAEALGVSVGSVLFEIYRVRKP